MRTNSIWSHSDKTTPTQEGGSTASKMIQRIVQQFLPDVVSDTLLLHQLEGYVFNSFAQPPLSPDQLQQERHRLLVQLQRVTPSQQHPQICFLLDTLDGLQITLEQEYLSSPQALQQFLTKRKRNLFNRLFSNS